MFDNKLFYCPGRKSKLFCALNNIFAFVGARSGFSCFMINGLIIIVILVVVAINVLSLSRYDHNLMKKRASWREKRCDKILFDLVQFFPLTDKRA